MSAITIHTATTAHAPALTALGITTFVHAFGQHNTTEDMDKYVAEEMNQEKITAELSMPDNTFFLAWAGDTLAGYAKVRTANPDEQLAGFSPMEIERLYVLHTCQNKKIGEQLVDHAIAFARSRGHNLMWLGVWEHNPNAIRFYKRLGFAPFGTHGFMLGNDQQTDILMKKQI